jgi:hypothetical protein
MNKLVKNEQWYIKNLMHKIEKEEISQPKFQRKKKWDKNLVKENNPNVKSYISFLFEVKNSVHAITFGQNMNSNKITYTNIDGNNRINAIKSFIDKPFDIFPEYLQELNEYIDKLFSDSENKLVVEDVIELKDIFINISYNNIIDIKLNKYFEVINKNTFYLNKLKKHREDFDNVIERIQDKLKVDGKDRFDMIVSINVNLFEGYNTDELCKIFEDINKYNSKLTELELLACSLYGITDFIINDNVIELSIKNEIQTYYKEKSSDEALKCYEYNNADSINAYDFIIGFQNYCNMKYKNIIEKNDNNGLSLFFKLYKVLFGIGNDEYGNQSFNSKNINSFIEFINYSLEILQKVCDRIFTENLDDKLFNKTCRLKIAEIPKNKLYIILSSIIGYKIKNVEENKIVSSTEQSILFHFFVYEINNKEKKDIYQAKDYINSEGAGIFIDNKSKKLLKEPSLIIDSIDENCMKDVINILLDEGYKEYQKCDGDNKNKDKRRRNRKFFEKCLLFYFYKQNMPINLLDNKFSIEHIFPFSSIWKDEIDIDRIGNVIPIIHYLNNKRGNNHISEYDNIDSGKTFFLFTYEIMPKIEVYDEIIKHNNEKKRINPSIINNDKYNDFCKRNEEIYIEKFIKCVFR